MKQTRWQRIQGWFGFMVYRVWRLRWYLPTCMTRASRELLVWRADYADDTMRRVLDDLETRNDEVTARARLYNALTRVD